MEQFGIVVNQILTFVLLIGIGVIAVKCKVLDQTGLTYISKFIIKISLPLMLLTKTINGATRDQLLESLPMLFLVMCMFAALFWLSVVLAKVFHLEHNQKQVYKAMFTFGNIGFMGIPLVVAILPERGMLYICLFTVVDQTILWTLGVYLTTPVEKAGNSLFTAANLKKMANPAIVCIVLAVVCVMLGWTLPGVLNTTLTGVGATTSSLSLIYIGGLFCYTDIKKYFRRLEFSAIIVVKMLIFPIVFYMILSRLPINPEIMLSLTVLSALPSMTTMAMLAESSGSDGEYAIGAVMVTTMASIITLPFIFFVITLL